MPRPEFRKPAARRRPTPIVELLEGRAMLNATAVTTRPAVPVHAEVAKVDAEQAKLARQEKAEATKLARQEKAEATKLARQQEAAQAKLAGQEKAAQAKLVKAEAKQASPVAGEKAVKAGNAFTDLYDIVPDTLKNVAQDTTPLAGQYTPQELQTAYGVNLLGADNEGQGTTIGIVDEFDDPNIISDANVYSAQYGLPQFNTAGGPTMVVAEDNFNGTVTSASGTGVAGETSLDVEIAHAMAPKANILLVEVPGSGESTYAQVFAQLLHGVQVAAGSTVAGTPVVAVSLSYGIGEANVGAANVTSQNNTYLAAGAASNIAVTVSTGDASSPEYPATSPNVIGVGGTSLFLDSARGDYGYETAWGGLALTQYDYSGGAGGGGPSTNFASPTFQTANGVNLANGKRTIPDVSLNADPYTGVSIYDSLDYPGSGWTQTGGTSEASPMFAGILDLAQQQRIDNGQSLLTSVQINTKLYQAYTNSTTYADLFNDVTLGKNVDLNARTGRTSVAGYFATTGYDEATGLGSPYAPNMVPYLATGVDPGI